MSEHKKSIGIPVAMVLVMLAALAPAKSWGWAAGDVRDERTLVVLAGEESLTETAASLVEIAISQVAQLGGVSVGSEEAKAQIKVSDKEALICMEDVNCVRGWCDATKANRAIVGTVRRNEAKAIVVGFKLYTRADNKFAQPRVFVADAKINEQFAAELKKVLDPPALAPTAESKVAVHIKQETEFPCEGETVDRQVALLEQVNKGQGPYPFYNFRGFTSICGYGDAECMMKSCKKLAPGTEYEIVGMTGCARGQTYLHYTLVICEGEPALLGEKVTQVFAESWPVLSGVVAAKILGQLTEMDKTDVEAQKKAAEAATAPTVVVAPPQPAPTPAPAQAIQPAAAAECEKGFDETLAAAREYVKKKWFKPALEKALTARDKCGPVPGKDHVGLYELVGKLFYELNDIGSAIEAFEMVPMGSGSESDKAEVKTALEVLKKEYVKVSVKPTPDDSLIVLDCPGTVNLKKKAVIQTAIERAAAGKPFEFYLPKPANEGECKIGTARIIVVEGGAVPIPFKTATTTVESNLRFGGSLYYYPTISGGGHPLGGSLGLGFYDKPIAGLTLKLGADLGYLRTMGTLSDEEYNRSGIGQLEALFRAQLAGERVYALGEIGPVLITEGGVGGGVSTVLAMGFKFYKEWSMEIQGRATFGNIGFLWAPLCVRGEL